MRKNDVVGTGKRPVHISDVVALKRNAGAEDRHVMTNRG